MKHTDIERAAFDAALSRIDYEFTQQQKELLIKHLDLVVAKNESLNLTRITSFEDAVVRHIEDSLSVLPEFDKTQGRFIDIGTGGGFPGIPLGVVTGREGVLLDSVQKKAAAVQEFIDELCLGNQLEACGLRSEELAKKQPESFDVVIARAVATQPVVMEFGAPLLRFNGFLIVMKGSESTEDEKMAENASSRLGFERVSVRKFKIGNDLYDRSAYVYEKVREPEIKLPRRPGMATKRPIC